MTDQNLNSLGSLLVSTFMMNIFPRYRAETLRSLVAFFQHHVKIDELQDLEESEDRPADLQKLQDCAGSRDKALFTCMGVGYLNLNKGIL